MQVVATFSDEGKSGKNPTSRPQFQAMMQRIQNGNEDHVDYVLVFKLSRFGRNAADVLNNLQIMQDFGGNLICVEDGIDSSSAAGKILFPVLPVLQSWNAKTSRRRRWLDADRKHERADGTSVRLHTVIGSRMVCLSLKNPKPPSFG